MEIAAPIYTPEGQKAHEKGYHKNLFQVSLESVSFLWSSPLIQGHPNLSAYYVRWKPNQM